MEEPSQRGASALQCHKTSYPFTLLACCQYSQHLENTVKEKVDIVKRMKDGNDLTAMFDKDVKKMQFMFTKTVVGKIRQYMKSST